MRPTGGPPEDGLAPVPAQGSDWPDLPALPAAVLHGALLRPPALRWDGQRHGGARLRALGVPDALPGVVEVVRRQDFVGVVAVAAVLARQAAERLRPDWQEAPGQAFGQKPAQAPEPPSSSSPPESGLPGYAWQLPARSSHQGAATAWCVGGYATVWVPCALAERAGLRAELAGLLQLAPGRITLVETDPGPSGWAHPLDVLDAAADAALLSQAVQRPVRVPLSGSLAGQPLRLWPTPATPPTTEADLAAAGRPPAPDVAGDGDAGITWQANVPWAVRPSLARLLSQPQQAHPCGLPALCGEAMAAPVQATPQPLAHAAAAELDAAQVFAQEVWLDEQAARAGADPLAYRLRHLPEGPGRRLVQRLAERIGGPSGPGASGADGSGWALAPRRPAEPDGRLHGRGYASAHVWRPGVGDENGAGAPTEESWSAWMAEVAVAPDTGRIEVTRVVVGRDGRALHAAQAAGIDDEDPRLLAAARQLLAAPARFDDWPGLPPGDAAAAPVPAPEQRTLAPRP
ncbi:MAG: hypothetical protein QM617_03375, partial [Comamonas sp.]